MKKSVLTIESNRALQYLVATVLKSKYPVSSVQNSRHAMQLFSSGYEADLIIIDIPNKNTENFELLDHIVTSSVFKDVPIIVLSANRDEELKNSCLQIGAADFLTKPFDPVYLFEKVNQLLSENIPDIISKRRRIFNSMNIFLG
jgi:CheY-like chemotaxis protein